MERFVKGDIVVVPFPFSDLTNSKKRPALVIAELDGEDRILCQITRGNSDRHSIQITQADCDDGGLNQTCNVRSSKIFTADKKIIIRRVGHLNPQKVQTIIEDLKVVLSR
jgi:mRNA interferase MazF